MNLEARGVCSDWQSQMHYAGCMSTANQDRQGQAKDREFRKEKRLGLRRPDEIWEEIVKKPRQGCWRSCQESAAWQGFMEKVVFTHLGQVHRAEHTLQMSGCYSFKEAYQDLM